MKRSREETSPSTTRLGHGGTSTVDISIPLDLTVEILKKLPSKSLVKFQCVSKQWSSIISRRRDFIESIVTRAARDAHLIFEYISGYFNECFLVFPSNTCPTDKRSLLIPGDTHQYVRGLICCWSSYGRDETAVYNLTTRQSFHIPKPSSFLGTFLFGYDPLQDQYKVLFLPLYDPLGQACRVFTLGDPTSKQWRTIQGAGYYHYPRASGICINGVIYYRAYTREYDSTCMFNLMSFHVRSEKFCHVDDAPKTLIDHFSTLINYQGKLGFVCCYKGVEIWVREEDGDDQKTQGWFKIFFYEVEGFEIWRISGVTRAGEIVFVNKEYASDDMLGVLYYDPKRNSTRYVDLVGTYQKEQNCHKSFIIWTLPDHVENTMRLY